jgi:hypothetical protein
VAKRGAYGSGSCAAPRPIDWQIRHLLKQAHFAHTMGCDLGQGYLIGRPAPADELLQLFEAPRLVPPSVA